MVRSQVCVVLSTALSAILCALAVSYNVTAIAKYRTDDFLTATKVEDFAAQGTCVEVITPTQLKDAGFDHDFPSCNSDNTKGKQGSLRDALAASVHGLYYSYYTLSDQIMPMPDVVETVFTATLGGSTAVPNSVSFSTGYAALTIVTENTIPTSCDTIYNMNGEDSLTEGDAVTYLAQLRKGDGDADWPLAEIPVRCNEHESAVGTSTPIDVSTALSAVNTQKLYAHCLTQFQFAASGAGPFGVPKVGKDGGPNGFFYPNADGFNSTAPYSTKARMYLGQRFGWSLFAYIPMLLTTCYLLADAVVYFLAEATETVRNRGALDGIDSQLRTARVIATIEATDTTIRAYRFSIGLAGVVVSWIFYGVFIILPWHRDPFQSIETVMPRPICEEGVPDHKFGPIPIGYTGSRGGWEKDVNATVYEIVTLFTQLFVLLLLPFTASTYCFCNRTCFRRKTDNNDTPLPVQAKGAKKSTKKHLTSPDERLRIVLTRFFGLIVFATICMLAGQAVSGAAFGMAWAIGVVGIETVTDEVTGVTSPAFNPVTIVDMVYDQTMATVSVTLVVGFSTGTILARYLIKGTTRFSALIFFLWVCLALLFWSPLIYYASVRSITNPNSANEDCKTFPKGYGIAKTACEARFWTLIICGGFILLVLLLMILYGVFRNVPFCVRVKDKVRVRVTNGFNKVSDLWRRGEPGINGALLSGAAPVAGFNVGGYRSTDQPFFNFQTTVGQTEERKALLHPARVSFAFKK
jgi:hypothetical protein